MNAEHCHPVLAPIEGGLVVSCQAYPGEPMRHAETMAQLAESAAGSGAVGIRAQGLEDIALIHSRVRLPQIGLIKTDHEGVFITPTLEDAVAVAEAGAEIVALDGTRRPRPDRLTLAETVAAFRQRSDAVLMADCGSLADALVAVDAGVDCLGTTLAGYTPDRPKTEGPDLALVAELVRAVDLPVLAEGRIRTLDDAVLAHKAGAFAVVVGTAITHPSTITSWFAQALKES